MCGKCWLVLAMMLAVGCGGADRDQIQTGQSAYRPPWCLDAKCDAIEPSDPAPRYVVRLEQASLTDLAAKFCGEEICDVYARIIVGDGKWSSREIADTVEPVWQEALIPRISAEDLLEIFVVELYDKEPWNQQDQLIATCEPTLLPEQFEADELAVESDCFKVGQRVGNVSLTIQRLAY